MQPPFTEQGSDTAHCQVAWLDSKPGRTLPKPPVTEAVQEQSPLIWSQENDTCQLEELTRQMQEQHVHVETI